MALSEWPDRWTQSDEVRHAAEFSDSQILDDIVNERLSDAELVNYAFWVRICQVRALNQDLVPDALWERICRKRGYAMSGRY